MSARVFLSRAARASVRNPASLEKQAEAVATKLAVPAGVEFVQFEHAGKTYALSASVSIEVEVLRNRVPDVVIRTGQIRRQR